MNIPFLSFKQMNNTIREEVLAKLESCFDRAWYIMGDDLKKFESEYAAFSNTKYCIGVGNGLDALIIALKALNIGKGDEVIVPSNTYIATIIAIANAGATPVLAEPDNKTFNLAPENISPLINSKTKAILPVHLYGQCSEMDAIMNIAEKNKLFVVEDNAQSHGSFYNGKIAGSFGHINATSFYPGKNLGALGDGGGITTNDDQLAETTMMYRNYGSKVKYYNEIVGINSRLDEMHAGVLSIKLKYLSQWSEERMKIAARYNENLSGLSEIILPEIAPNATHVYHLYVIRSKRRDELQKYLSSKNIGTLIHYPVPSHLQKAFGFLNAKKGDYPIAEEMAETCLSIPIYIGMSNDEIDYVSETIINFYKN